MTQPWYDVLVVGSGGGALTGAALAAKAGLSVAVVEKTELLGGTSAYSGGACWLPGSQVQQRAGLPDSTDGARAYLAAILESADDPAVAARVE
ncbi:FAD-binding protein, partial [Nocardioides sp.]|uniref:FAD-binding protein n=1 Tax=Nocardioides sp. TaxID=35761 RepID=UPI002B27574A